jgi:catechol 2,3-dioxygenase-like lactoylglutathione lyase family enzyme
LFKLIEYHHPDGCTFDRVNSDVGVMHLCLEIANIETTCKLLAAKGISLNAPPIHVNDGPSAGYSFAYFQGHDGLSFELFEVPSH